MLRKLEFIVPKNLIDLSIKNIPTNKFKCSINQPTGRFFYDPWVIDPLFKNTVWENILKTLPFSIGEARIIILKPGTSYQVHADIDDRFHLNLQEEHGYLIDLDNNILHRLLTDGFWYEMDAGRLHTATNFGRYERIQLVVRKLLKDVNLIEPKDIKIVSNGHTKDTARFLFDNMTSPWLNYANKNNLISDFNFIDNIVIFKIEKNEIENLRNFLPNGFEII